MYNITKGQLITIWIIGIVLSFYELFHGLSIEEHGGFHITLFLVIPLLLIFYSLGWKSRNMHKK